MRRRSFQFSMATWAAGQRSPGVLARGAGGGRCQRHGHRVRRASSPVLDPHLGARAERADGVGGVGVGRHRLVVDGHELAVDGTAGLVVIWEAAKLLDMRVLDLADEMAAGGIELAACCNNLPCFSLQAIDTYRRSQVA